MCSYIRRMQRWSEEEEEACGLCIKIKYIRLNTNDDECHQRSTLKAVIGT